MASASDRLTALLEAGRDDALLRFGLANACLAEERVLEAIEHAAKALEHDPGFSACWKLYGRALGAAGRDDDARAAYERGIEIAESRGDVQAAKEMRVFLKRLGPGPGRS